MSSQIKLAIIGVVFVIVLVAVPVVWQVNAILSDPNVPFLIGENNAEWIRLNTTEGPTTFTGSEQTTIFRTRFSLAAVPEEAVLTVRPFRNASILLDDKVLAETRADPKEWKRRTLLDLAQLGAPMGAPVGAPVGAPIGGAPFPSTVHRPTPSAAHFLVPTRPF